MEKHFVATDIYGNIVAVASSNDPTFVLGDGDNMYEIDLKTKDRISGNTKDFKVKAGKVKEINNTNRTKK